jgi:LPS sulfotransferase NodH
VDGYPSEGGNVKAWMHLVYITLIAFLIAAIIIIFMVQPGDEVVNWVVSKPESQTKYDTKGIDHEISVIDDIIAVYDRYFKQSGK